MCPVPKRRDQTVRGAVQPAVYRARDRLLRLFGKIANGGGHSANYGALGCCPGKAPDGTYSPLTQTIDAALGKALPAVFPQLVLGVAKDANLSMINNCSASGKNKPIPTICNAALAYSTVFGSVAEGAARQQFNSDRNLLDFMVDDIRRAESQLTGGEREKFQQHLNAFEALREQQSRLNEIESTLRKHAPVYSDKYKSPLPSDQWPLLVIGDLGGRLKTRGRFLGYPKYGADGHRTMANLYLSFLHAVGDRRKAFGVPDPNLRDLDQTGPLAELI